MPRKVPAVYNESCATIECAVAAGVGYLSQAVPKNGAWPANAYHVHAPLAGADTHSPPFVTGLGTMSLDACEHPHVTPVLRRSRAYLNAAMMPGQLWRYAPFLPPDADDTAICSMATGRHPHALANVDAMAAQRDGEGRFLTWLPFKEPEHATESEGELLGPEFLPPQPDAVVSANVIAHLGDRTETRPAQNWLRRLIVDSPEDIDSNLHYYPHALDLDIAIARASDVQAPALAGLRQPVTERIFAAQTAAGTFVDIMRTAQALTALPFCANANTGLDSDVAESARVFFASR